MYRDVRSQIAKILTLYLRKIWKRLVPENL